MIMHHDMFVLSIWRCVEQENRCDNIVCLAAEIRAGHPRVKKLRLMFATLTARYSFFPSRMTVVFVDEKLEHLIIYYFVSQFWAIFMKQIGWYNKSILGACLCIMRIYTEFGIMSVDEDPNAHHMADSLCVNEKCLRMLLVSMKQCRTTMNLWYHRDNESSSSVTGRRFLWSLHNSWCMLTNFYLKDTLCTSICGA